MCEQTYYLPETSLRFAVPRNCGMWRWIPEWLEYWRPNGEVWRSIPLWRNELTSVDTTVENEYLLP